MISVLVFWHQHQPFYKDLLSGEYRLPWTRMHGLKDYFGMVAMLEDLPEARLTFHLVPALVKKERGFTREDQMSLWNKHQELLGRILTEHREAQDRGQVELTTSPFYHPILPLLCDSDIGAESNPHIQSPRRFRHPEDARL